MVVVVLGYARGSGGSSGRAGWSPDEWSGIGLLVGACGTEATSCELRSWWSGRRRGMVGLTSGWAVKVILGMSCSGIASWLESLEDAWFSAEAVEACGSEATSCVSVFGLDCRGRGTDWLKQVGAM